MSRISSLTNNFRSSRTSARSLRWIQISRFEWELGKNSKYLLSAALVTEQMKDTNLRVKWSVERKSLNIFFICRVLNFWISFSCIRVRFRLEKVPRVKRIINLNCKWISMLNFAGSGDILVWDSSLACGLENSKNFFHKFKFPAHEKFHNL